MITKEKNTILELFFFINRSKHLMTKRRISVTGFIFINNKRRFVVIATTSSVNTYTKEKKHFVLV